MRTSKSPCEPPRSRPARPIAALAVAILLGAAAVTPVHALPITTGWSCGMCWPGYIVCLNSCDPYCGSSCYAHCVNTCRAALQFCLGFFSCGGGPGGYIPLFPENVEATTNPVFAATPSEIQAGKEISIRWYAPEDWSALANVPASVTGVEFHAVTLAEFDSSLAADSSLASVPFSFLGLGTPDSVVANRFSFTLPDVFLPDTPYVVAALVHDSQIPADSAQVAFAPLYVSDGAHVGAAEIRRDASGASVSTFPNPSTDSARIEYQIPRAAPVSLEIFDVSGRLVRTLARSPSQTPGGHSSTWDGRDDGGRPVKSGIYFVRLDAGGVRETQRIVRLR